MAKDYAELLKDPRWQKKRLLILNRDEWVCQNCAGSEETLHVHHIRYSKGMPWDVPDEHLITLCESCHAQEENLKSKDLYELISDVGVTRKMIIVLLDHVKWRMTTSNEQLPMMKFARILDDIRGDDGQYVEHILSALLATNGQET